jgi:hypothetical protein
VWHGTVPITAGIYGFVCSRAASESARRAVHMDRLEQCWLPESNRVWLGLRHIPSWLPLGRMVVGRVHSASNSGFPGLP